MQLKQRSTQTVQQANLEPTSLFTPCGKFVKVANFSLVACKKVVFSSQEYFEYMTVKSSQPNSGVFAGYREFLPASTFHIIPSGVNQRKYLHVANPALSELISEELGEEETEWLTQIALLQQLCHKTDIDSFWKHFK